MNPQPSGGTAAERLAWAVVILITLGLCYFSHLGGIGFVGPDEPRYAWIARDMAETGDWVTPRLYGKPWFEKPVLYYWGAALSFKLFGVSEAAARLPSAISALLLTLGLAWLAWRTCGEECARWLLLLLPTSAGMIGFSHAAATDMPFAGMLTLAMVCAAAVLGLTRNENSPILPRTPWLALFLFGFFLGLAVLAKGPAAIVLGGGAVLFWALFTKRWREAFRLLHPASIAAFCATALPWYTLCARRNPDFFRVFIIEHNFKRYLTPEFRHTQPLWFYVPILLLALFPWAPAALVVARRIFKKGGDSAARSLGIFTLCWFAWPLLFFSLSQSKLPGYILPAIPPAILLTGQFLFSDRQASPPERRIFTLIAGATLAVSGAAFLIFRQRIPGGQEIAAPSWHGAVYVPLLLGGIAAVVIAWRNAVGFSAMCCGATLLLALAGLYGGLPWLDPLYSARKSVRDALALYPAFDPSQAAAYQLPRGIQFGLNYYLRRETEEWSPGGTPPRWVFTPYRGLAQVRSQGFRCPHYSVLPAALPCEDAQLLDRLGGGRQPK